MTETRNGSEFLEDLKKQNGKQNEKQSEKQNEKQNNGTQW